MFEQHERNISIKKINPGMSYPEYGSDASESEQKSADEDSEKTESDVEMADSESDDHDY